VLALYKQAMGNRREAPSAKWSRQVTVR